MKVPTSSAYLYLFNQHFMHHYDDLFFLCNITFFIIYGLFHLKKHRKIIFSTHFRFFFPQILPHDDCHGNQFESFLFVYYAYVAMANYEQKKKQ